MSDRPAQRLPRRQHRRGPPGAARQRRPARRPVRAGLLPGGRARAAASPRSCGATSATAASSACTCPRSTAGAAAASPTSPWSSRSARRRAARCSTSSSRSICGPILLHHGSQVLKDRWLPGSPTARRRWPSPSPSRTPAPTPTRSRRPPRRSRAAAGGISGGKYWTSGVDEADALLVVCRDAEPGPSGKPHRCRCSSSTPQRPGLTLQVIDSALGAPERQFIVFFDDVPVAPDGLDRRAGPGLQAGLRRAQPRAGRRGGASPTASRCYALGKAATYANRARGLGRPDRRPPGRRAPAGQVLHRGAAGPADERPGRRAVRRGAGRRGGGQHGQVRRRRGLPRRARQRDPDPRRQRPVQRVRPVRPVVHRPDARAPRRSAARWSSTTSRSTASGCPRATRPSAGPCWPTSSAGTRAERPDAPGADLRRADADLRRAARAQLAGRQRARRGGRRPRRPGGGADKNAPGVLRGGLRLQQARRGRGRAELAARSGRDRGRPRGRRPPSCSSARSSSPLVPADLGVPTRRHGRRRTRPGWPPPPRPTRSATSRPTTSSLQLYSSGTTGRAQGRACSPAPTWRSPPGWPGPPGGWARTAVNLVASPLFHIGGAGYGLTALSQGGHTVLARDAAPAALLDAGRAAPGDARVLGAGGRAVGAGLPGRRGRRPVQPAAHRLRRGADDRGAAAAGAGPRWAAASSGCTA